MKKISLILPILVILGFGIASWGQCPEDPNDLGLCDTMYVEPWPSDTIFEFGGSHLVRVPIYTTTDVADEWDSIPAFVIPLCFSSSNPSAAFTLDPAWNNTDLYPFPDTDRSIFRHFIEGGDTLVYNRMMSLSQEVFTGEEWDTRILDLSDSHFWLALITTGTQDKRWWDGSRVLLATMTFTLQDSSRICIDTCFWPPLSRLAWVTYPAGGGYPTTKIPRPGTGSSFETCFNVLPPDPVDCYRSYSDPCLVACPLGDIPYRVYLRDCNGVPVPNYSSVWLDFSGCSGIVPCPNETAWPLVYPDGPSDLNGVVTFHVHAGGCDELHQLQVMSRCGLIGNRLRPVKTVDPNGDLVVSVSDWHGVGVDPCNDYNCNGEVNFWDVDFFSDHITHRCDPDQCLLFSQDLTISPDTLLPVDSTHQVRLLITNHNTGPCTAEYVAFYRAGFGQGTSLFQFALRYLNEVLAPGDTISAVADFVVPGEGSGYILTEFFTDCCAHPLNSIFNFTQRMCPPDSMVYVFPLLLGSVPAYVETLEYMPEEWYWFIYETGGVPDSVAIITPDSSILGVTGGVSLYFFDGSSNLIGYRMCEVRLTLNSGDVNSDCVVGAGDVVFLINYLFRNGQFPDPLRAGDVNCDCLVGAGDVVYLINYLFRNGPPPVSSETCECGYKGWSTW